ncbi:protein phosphatase 1F [Clupea harengus]|uniref:Protein phosphatase 1E n=1 Tax=Clupea harengus TaxID=7950 RepID=A0A6P3VHB6_CLUHA|nr:protein phosphatase 1F [Clupea harengus]
MMVTVESGVAQSFLEKFLKEFPEPFSPDNPPPVNPLSRKVSHEEIRGESLDLGLRLLAAREAPPSVSVALCQAAVSELMKSDLTPFQLPQETEQQQEEDQPPVILLECEGLQHLFLNKLREVAASWRQQLPAAQRASTRFSRCCVHAIRNTRRKMEDRHVTVADFNRLLGIQDGVDRQYYAVFDGHGGGDAATFAATHLHVVLSQQEDLVKDPGAAFKATFTHVDDMFKVKAKRERLRSGSTGIVVLLAGDWLHVSWLGDSQAMLVRQGEPVILMDPHKPEREDEKQRIENLGGCIAFMGCWRVNGTYAVSRAIGDFDQKPYVSNMADCSSVQLAGDEDYVLLACDGFFDVVRPSEVPGLVLEALREMEGRGGCEEVAQRLVAQAKAAGSSDNITVLVVFLREPGQLLLQDQGSPGQAGAAAQG